MQIANVKHSRCEAKFGFRVWETKFGCVHRKTLPTKGGKCLFIFRFHYKLVIVNSQKLLN